MLKKCPSCIKHISFSHILKPILFFQYQWTKYTIFNNKLKVHQQKILTIHFQQFFQKWWDIFLGCQVLSQVATSQGYFPKWQLPKGIFPAATSQVCPIRSAWPPACSNRGARPHSPSQLQRLAPISACSTSEKLGSCHLENYHLGSRPWENASGKVPNTIPTTSIFGGF